MASTRYNKWLDGERISLFHGLKFQQSKPTLISRTFPKLTDKIEWSILDKLEKQKVTLGAFYRRSSEQRIYYSRKVGYFLQVLDFQPRVLDGSGSLRPPSEFKELRFDNDLLAKSALGCLNSSLFYWFITVFSDCRHVNKREVDAFPIDLGRLASSKHGSRLIEIARKLMSDVEEKSENRRMRFKHDALYVQCIFPKRSKALIDLLDAVLAEHYGFTDNELDFILNYDIKYRMGRDAHSGDDQ